MMASCNISPGAGASAGGAGLDRCGVHMGRGRVPPNVIYGKWRKGGPSQSS